MRVKWDPLQQLWRRAVLPHCSTDACASSASDCAPSSSLIGTRVNGRRSGRLRAVCVSEEGEWGGGGASGSGSMRASLPRHLASALYQQGRRAMSGENTSVFRPRRVLILSKITRYEFEKKVHDGVEEELLENMLRRRGSDYSMLRLKHQQHYEYLDTIKSELAEEGIESRVVQRFDYDEQAVEWADAILTAGGDGTFLMAASKIRSRQKPVIGINTDPAGVSCNRIACYENGWMDHMGSEGYMCLMRKLPKEHFRSAFKRLLGGDFQWLWRQRIRITLSGEGNGVGESVALHDQQLNRDPSTTRWSDNPREMPNRRRLNTPPTANRVTMELPVLALNEVFVGESLSSRVSYYEIQLNGGKLVKQKSSGITICTGTGSTSWYFNINKLTPQCVNDLLGIAAEETGSTPPTDPKIVENICTRFNQQLIFNPDLPRMAFSVRDPVFNATFPATAPRGFADKIRVRSRGYDAHLVVDGGVSFRFNDGAEAMMEVREEDAIRTVIFR